MLMRDFDWLLALAEHGNVSDAAASLGISQPTLSRALARVEEEVGTRLFDRVSTGVHPNASGDLAIEAARDLSERFSRLLLDLGDRLDPDTGIIRLAFLDSMATSLVPRLLRAFHRSAPGVRVLLRQEPGHDIIRDLLTGVSELAITGARPPGSFGWMPLQDERIVLVVPPRHRLSGRKRVSLDELADEDIITTPLGFGFRSLVERVFAEADATMPSISFESGDLATIEGLVAAGLGVALVPEPFAGASGTVGIPLRSAAARRTVGLTWCNDRTLAPPATRFLDFVRETRLTPTLRT